MRKKEAVKYISDIAYRALIEEIYTTPKPGLVDCFSNGSHDDMDVHTFVRSAGVLQPYFGHMAAVGYEYYERGEYIFPQIREIGIEAERAMFEVTEGVNTHKGALFAIGILSASTAACLAEKEGLSAALIIGMQQKITGRILEDELIKLKRKSVPESNGEGVYRQYGMGGARAEAVSGYASVRRYGLPVLDAGMKEKRPFNQIKLQVLLTLMSVVADSNVLHRRNGLTLVWVQDTIRLFLQSGGAYRDDAEKELQELDHEFIKRSVSCGGCADLLAVTLFLHFAAGEGEECI